MGDGLLPEEDSVTIMDHSANYQTQLRQEYTVAHEILM